MGGVALCSLTVVCPEVAHNLNMQSLCALSLSCVRLFSTPWPDSSVHGYYAGKNIRVGYHALLQGIFPTQGLNPGPPIACSLYGRANDDLLQEDLGHAS